MTLVIKGQILSFTADGAARHEARGAVAVGDDGTILWSGPLPLLPQGLRQAEAHDHGEMKGQGRNPMNLSHDRCLRILRSAQ